MNGRPSVASSFARTVLLLLQTARKRSAGRSKRQQEILHHTSGGRRSGSKVLGWTAFVLTVAGMALVQFLSAFLVFNGVHAAQRALGLTVGIEHMFTTGAGPPFVASLLVT